MRMKKIYQIDDKTMKYIAIAETRRMHKYLKLPGEYISSYPNEVVLPNMESGRADAFYAVTGGLLINLEEESGEVNEKTLQKFSKYLKFGNFIHCLNVYTAVICKKNPKNFPKEYEISPTNILRPKYIYFEQKELWRKYENIIKKIEQRYELSEMEALDFAFIPKFISDKYAPQITEAFSNRFKDVIINEKELKTDVGVILGAMILKNIADETKQKRLLEMIGMDQGLRNDIQMIFEDEFREINEKLDEKTHELNQKNQEINQKTHELNQKTHELNQKNQEINQKTHELNQKNEALENISNVVKQLHNEGEINTDTMNKILQTCMTSK